MRVDITSSQRMALLTILTDRMRDQEAAQLFIDCSQDVETTTPELLSLFMDAAPPLTLNNRELAEAIYSVIFGEIQFLPADARFTQQAMVLTQVFKHQQCTQIEGVLNVQPQPKGVTR